MTFLAVIPWKSKQQPGDLARSKGEDDHEHEHEHEDEDEDEKRDGDTKKRLASQFMKSRGFIRGDPDGRGGR
jgi:hypothetical protein